MDLIHVVLADDHPIVRAGIRALLKKKPGISVVAEACNGEQALQMVKELLPEVLLLDMEMPDMTGLEVARRLKAEGSSVRILVLSAYDEEQYIRELLANGAAGYLIKDEAPQKIVEAIRGVAQGEEGWLSRRAAASITANSHEEHKEKEKYEPSLKGVKLTDRELTVLRLLAEGKSNQDISNILNISVKTVEKHMGELMSRMGVASRLQVVIRAVKESLV